MTLTFDLSTSFAVNDDLTITGSFTSGYAGSQGVFQVSGSQFFFDDQSPIMGRWPGSATNYGAMLIVTSDLSSLASGSWFGSSTTWGSTPVAPENHDKAAVTSDANPSPAQGINEGEFNPFPSPVVAIETPAVGGTNRDASRFSKTYSFNRNQPVRFRIFKR